MPTNQKILIVEDDHALQNALREKFTKEGFEVSTAGDGEEGLATALREHPDMMLLDIIMPKMDGLTCLERLREDDWGKTARVIVLTNLGDAENVSRSLERGAFEYFVKIDWSLEDIVKRVRDRLEKDAA